MQSWLLTMIPCSMLMTGIGIFAIKRKKPMWFWSGTTVSEDEIRDIPAYNKANGIMWIVYSLFYWASTFAYFISEILAIVILVAGCTVGILALVVSYNKIYKKYSY